MDLLFLSRVKLGLFQGKDQIAFSFTSDARDWAWISKASDNKSWSYFQIADTRRVYTSGLRMQFLHCVAFPCIYIGSLNQSLTLIEQTNVNTGQMQCNAENAKLNRKWQLGLIL